MQIFVLFVLTLMATVKPDPAPGLFRTKTASAELDCEQLTVARANQERPGQIGEARPRGDYVDRRVVVCSERLISHGVRPVRDEAILSTLDARADEVASAAAALGPDLQSRTWLVETYYPSVQVASKVSFAAKNSLMEHGLTVSDRTPILGFGDLDVITRMPAEQAYPAACKRYYATGSLGEQDALLAVVSRDPRETILHAGLCSRGQWKWLR